MEIAQYENITINIIVELSKSADHERAKDIERYRKIAEKGAMTCPFCHEKLLLRAGEVRDIHFAHVRGKTCMGSEAYDTYQTQIKRENKKHSVIKEIIYNELKSQEIIKPDLKVEYGHKEKAKEKWRHYPDIYLNKNGREFAVSVITNVHEIGDEKIVKTIKKRNLFFKEKGLEPIWFVEDRELADDYGNRVLHLWEAEYELATKTVEDNKWDRFMEELKQDFPDFNLFDLFKYKSRSTMRLNSKSLYYVHAVGDDISFSVYRLILDDKTHPFRGFALSEGYKMSISDALIVQEEILLSDNEQEDRNRIQFGNDFLFRIQEHQEDIRRQQEQYAAMQVLSEQEVPVYVDVEVVKARSNSTTSFINDFDIVECIGKLKTLRITEDESKLLFQFLKRHKRDLGDYALTFKEVLYHVNYALGGKVMDPNIRKWLVDIEYL
jgi:hypothetical protein